MSKSKSIIQWLDKQAKQEKEIKMRWEGGNDSGWTYFEIDGETVDNEYTNALLDYMYEVLDYGSWAGEFSANGEAIYDYKTRCFEGIDYYGAEESETISSNIDISVPKELWFDALHVECEANHDETPNISVRFIVKNGFLTDIHNEFCSKLEKELVKEFDDLFTNYQSNDESEFRSCYEMIVLTKADAEEVEDSYLFKIENVNIGVTITFEKPITFEITDEIEQSIDEKLNETEDAN